MGGEVIRMADEIAVANSRWVIGGWGLMGRTGFELLFFEFSR